MTFFCSSLDLGPKNWTSAEVLTFFFAIHLTLGGKQTASNCSFPPIQIPGDAPAIPTINENPTPENHSTYFQHGHFETGYQYPLTQVDKTDRPTLSQYQLINKSLPEQRTLQATAAVADTITWATGIYWYWHTQYRYSVTTVILSLQYEL